MTAGTSPAAAGAARTRRTVRFWLVLLGAVLLAALLVGAPGREGPPLDPASTDPLGTRALVLLLEARGATVELVSGPTSRHDTALVLADDLDPNRRSVVRQWVDAGGVLVVADPRSELHGLAPTGGARIGPVEPVLAGDCPHPALRSVERVDPAGGLLYRVPDGATGCFWRGDAAFVVLRSSGEGTVAALGGAAALVNGAIGQADNAVLAAALLAPRDGTTVAFLRPPPPGEGEAGLLDLVAPDVKQAVLQLAVAFVLFALWRARRLGRPVEEELPVELAGSELVAATGNLLQQAHRRDQAAALLRRRLTAELGERLGTGPGTAPEVVAEAAARRTGMPTERLLAVLAGGPVADDAALVELAHTIEAIRQEVVHA